VLGLVSFALLTAAPENHNIMFYGESMHDEKQVAFMDFIVRFGRSYATKGDLAHRFAAFSKNYHRIMENNKAS